MPLQQQQQQQQQQRQPVVPIDRGRLALVSPVAWKSRRGRLGKTKTLPSTLVRTRTVINQSQTLLYCSEACRKKDLEWSWPVPIPSAREISSATRAPTA
ncbi:hypothetical protein DFH11DRAFT_1648095 [Phellopilus nigrolimitatus]|nr:hypothetical protein DFH11DRAFT_1648095 [Phellopilus nigrolimitatus]